MLEGTKELLRSLYSATPYLDRLDALFLDARLGIERGRVGYLQRHPWRRIKTQLLWLVQTLVLFTNLMYRVPDAPLRRQYRRRLWRVMMRRCELIVLRDYVFKCILHYHMHVMVLQHQNIGTGFPTGETIACPAEGGTGLETAA